MKIKIKDSISVLNESENVYTFLFTGTRKIKKFQVDSLTKEIINELIKETTEEELLSKIKNKYKQEDISKCISALEYKGIIRKYSSIKGGRYDRQISFIDENTNSWEETINLQKKLENSVISVFGVGGIGTWIVNGLYQIGIGEIRISDPDKIEESNLNRQLFFDSRDIGKYKVDIIKKKLPDAKIIPFKKIISKQESLEEIILGSDFLINCADSPSVEETTQIIDKYAIKYNIPYCISGGYNMHLGMVGPIIIPRKSSTFNDLINHQKNNDSLSELKVIKDVTQSGNIGPIAGVIANMQVIEIFKYLINRGKLNVDKFVEIDFMNQKFNWIKFGG